MTRALIPKLSREQGAALRKVAAWELEKDNPNRIKADRSHIMVSEDGQTYYYMDGGSASSTFWEDLRRRDLVELHNHLFETYGFAGDVPRKLYRVSLTERGRAALVVFDATHDGIGRPLRRRA